MASLLSRAKSALAKYFGHALDATAPANPVSWDAGVRVENHKRIAWVRVGEFETSERIPLHVEHWPEERQSDYLDQVLERLITDLGMRKKNAPVAAALNRAQRRAQNRMTERLHRRIVKARGEGEGAA